MTTDGSSSGSASTSPSERTLEALEEQYRRAQEELREQTRVLRILNETGAVLASQLSTDGVVQTVTDAATELTGAQFGAFFYNVVNERGEAYTLYTLSGAPREKFSKFGLPRATPLFGPTFRGERVIRSDDILKDPLYGHWAPHHGMPAGHLPVRSYLAVPVVSRTQEVHGGLFFGHAEPARFSESHEEIVRGIAAQAAIAIDNTRLLESTRQVQKELEQANEKLRARVSERTSALQTSQQQFQQLVAGVNDAAIYMLDTKGFVTSWNPGARRIKGYSDEEIIGKHFSTFYTEEDRAADMPARVIETVLREGKYEAEGWRVRKDGTRFWASVLVDEIRNDAGEIIGLAKITRDMTERRAMQEQLHHSQRMEAIGQLTGGVAHDFNNLLTVILGNLEVLGRLLPRDDSRVRRALDQVVRGAERAATLTSQLLAFSRRQPLNPKSTDVNRLVTGMSDLVRRTLGENISIETVLAAGLWRTDVDAHQLESALLNLAVNARDAMPNGGKLTIETGNSHLDENYASQYAEISPGQYICISISDTGTGMPKEVIERAFDPFFTTKPMGQGTGLGLSQVFGFVKQSGGHIKLYSEVGQGTTVRMYLARSFSKPEEVELEVPKLEVVGSPDETILVVEDDDGVRAYSCDSLRELGFSVLEAADGHAGLRLLEHHPEIKLLFTDVGLPGLNGRELAEQARKRRPGLRILFTTGYARNAIVHQGRLDPGVELLTKPFSRPQLGLRIRQILDTSIEINEGELVALVVDDEPLVRMLLSEMLSDHGFRVVQASTAREALAAVERLPAIHLAIVDVGLPDRSGLEVTAELRTKVPSAKVVIASGYGQDTSKAFSVDNSVVSLAKPFDTAALTNALRTLGFNIAQ